MNRNRIGPAQPSSGTASASSSRKRAGECSRSTYSRPRRRISLEAGRVGEQLADGRGELLGREALEDDAAARVADERLRASARRGHDRQPGGERLGGGDPEAFLPRGEHEQRRAAEVRRRPTAPAPSPRRGPGPARAGRRSGAPAHSGIEGRASSSRRTFLRVSSARPTNASTGALEGGTPLLVGRRLEGVQVDGDRAGSPTASSSRRPARATLALLHGEVA